MNGILNTLNMVTISKEIYFAYLCVNVVALPFFNFYFFNIYDGLHYKINSFYNPYQRNIAD